MIDAAEVIERLRESDRRSGGDREAWTPGWAAERARLEASVPGSVRVERDAFANTWYVLPGRRAETVLVHSHSDSVPGGGWLDGILGVHAGLGLLRALAARGTPPPRTVAVVDWADEEGTRFGRSLLGSAAATGALSATEFAALRTPDGRPAAEITAPFGFQAARLGQPAARLADVVAAVELHIEQGPVLERCGRAVAAVAGCLGVRRYRLTLRGRAGHAGAIPMGLRADPARAAARFVAAVMDLAEARDGLATVGELTASPGLPTVVPAQVTLTLDIRHAEPAALEHLTAEALALAPEAKAIDLFSAAPVRFDPVLTARAASACGGGTPLVSGPLHDSVSLARAGVPTVMLFVASRDGVSHSRQEDSSEADLAAGLHALARLVGSLLDA